MYPFVETLRYKHQRVKAREEARESRAFEGDLRRVRRQIRKNSANWTLHDGRKFGKWVSEQFTSSRAFRSAYMMARSEQEFYDQPFY